MAKGGVGPADKTGMASPSHNPPTPHTPQGRSYIVLGIRPDGSEPARLRYATLDEAMQKIRDLVEADEIDDDGAMFCEYGIVMDPAPKTKHARDVEEDARRAAAEMPQMPSFIPPPAQAPDVEGGPAPFKFPGR